MATPVVLAPVVSGLPLSSTDLNNNWAKIENSLTDVAPYVISGLTLSIGTGLSVNVALGVAVIGAEITKAAFVIGSLTPSTTVHLFLNQDGTTTANTTGTQPAKSVKLGTAVTGASTVTSVAMGRTAGRQQFIQPQNLIHGGPAAGTTSAGHPASIDLAQWNATAAEGKTVFGTLPAGAVPATTAPVTFTLDDANATTVQTVLTLEHTVAAGVGGNFIGTALDLTAESTTGGTKRIAASLQGSLTNAIAASATSLFAVVTLDTNVAVTPLTVASKDVRIPQAAATASQHGLLNIGSGGFDGSANHFAGDAGGSYLAMNAPAGYGGSYLDLQKAGVRRHYLDQFGTLFHTAAPVATANDGLLSLGDAFTAFDGSTGGHFVGNANGTYLAVNGLNGFAGALLDLEQSGTSVVRVLANTGTNGAGQVLVNSATGVATLTLSRAVQSAPAVKQMFAVAGPADTNLTASTEAFDVNFNLNRVRQWATGAITTQRDVVIQASTYAFVGASTVTNAATLAITNAPQAGTNATLTNAYAFWVQAGGTRLDGNLGFGKAPVAQQTGASAAGIAAVLDANAKNALTALQAALAAFGFISSPA